MNPWEVLPLLHSCKDFKLFNEEQLDNIKIISPHRYLSLPHTLWVANYG